MHSQVERVQKQAVWEVRLFFSFFPPSPSPPLPHEISPFCFRARLSPPLPFQNDLMRRIPYYHFCIIVITHTSTADIYEPWLQSEAPIAICQNGKCKGREGKRWERAKRALMLEIWVQKWEWGVSFSEGQVGFDGAGVLIWKAYAVLLDWVYQHLKERGSKCFLNWVSGWNCIGFFKAQKECKEIISRCSSKGLTLMHVLMRATLRRWNEWLEWAGVVGKGGSCIF